MVLLSGSDLAAHNGQERRFLLLGLAASVANNKTAAFAGRCFEAAYRGGQLPRQADENGLHFKY
jgi:hypothetical protein